MSWIISTIVIAVPIMHLWLHALLPWWRKRPLVYYGFAILLGLGALLLTAKAEQISPMIFGPTGNYALAGYGLIVLGALGALSSILTLGPRRFFLWAVFYPDSVQRTKISRGIFGLVPHPAYFGYILAALGNLLSDGKLYLVGILVWAVILTPIVIYLEEQELTNRTGQ